MDRNTDRNFKAIETIIGLKIASEFYAFTHNELKRLNWSRGKNTNIYRGGKEEWDYMLETVTRYLEHPEKFKPDRADLLRYLKNTVKSIISSDVRADENQTTFYVDAYDTEGENEEEKNKKKVRNLEKMYPKNIPDYAKTIDEEMVMIRIKREIEGDEILEKIYEGSVKLDLPRREIIKKYKLSEKDYDNGIRRLDTVRTKVHKLMKYE